MSARIGIFGGTFDPVHLGHIHAAKSVISEFKLDKICLVPVFQPVHRTAPGATSTQRVDMLRLASASCASLEVDERELHRGGPSYSLFTVQEYRKQYPGSVLFFILGTDAFNSLHSWFQWRALFDYVNLIVLSRPDVDLTLSEMDADFLTPRLIRRFTDSDNTPNGNIYLSNEAMLDYSATAVRYAIDNHGCLDNLLDKKVRGYIKEHNIYRKDLLK